MGARGNYDINDYIGVKLNYLSPTKEVEERSKDGSKQWEFQCVCGEKVCFTPYQVISGGVKSCGCMRFKNTGNRSKVNPEDFIGQKNHMLTVIGYVKPKDGGRIKLKCLCDCGNETYLLPYQFKKGQVQSCGCKRVSVSYKHGYSKSRLYMKFMDMKSRCYNKNSDKYWKYGARGVTICQEWLDHPERFVEWAMEHGGLDENLTIDRIDTLGPYSPENCRFITNDEQQRNRTTDKILEYNGESHSVTDWSIILGIERKVLTDRLYKGWSIDRVLTEPFNESKSRKRLDTSLKKE